MQHTGISDDIKQAWLGRKNDFGVLTSDGRLAELLWQYYRYDMLCVEFNVFGIPPPSPLPPCTVTITYAGCIYVSYM